MISLVTGGAGFIGSNLVDGLIARGDKVVVIDNFSSGKRANLSDAEKADGSRLVVIDADIRSKEAHDALIEATPDVVFHLAAQIDVRHSVEDPVNDADINILGGLNILEAARKCEVNTFVFASSAGTIYGEDENLLPFTESAPQRPLSPYGISKSSFGDYLDAYSKIHGMRYVTTAFTNVFGPRQDPHGEAGVVAIFAQRLLDSEDCYIFGDGSATRDYVYVEDVVSSLIKGSERGTGLYNIGCGTETSTATLYSTMAGYLEISKEAILKPARVGELQRSVINNAKAQRELGWNPTVTVADGVARTIEYFRQQTK